MAQLFSPSANTKATVGLIMAAAVPFTIFYLGSTITRSPYNTGVTVPLDQPVPFSHKHHAVELGIDCRFCHSAVENGPVAGLPATEVCMSCHSQIWTNSPYLDVVRTSYETGVPIEWVRVNNLPDFVYFNHSIHIDRGVNCNVCHGPITQMAITSKGQTFHMTWCLTCHNDPEKFLNQVEGAGDMSPRQQVFLLYQKIIAGEKLNEAEHNIAEGMMERVPKDKYHENLEVMKKLGVNLTQMADCYVCHR